MFRVWRWLAVVCLVLPWVCSNSARADSLARTVNAPTVAEVFVLDGEVRVEIEHRDADPARDLGAPFAVRVGAEALPIRRSERQVRADNVEMRVIRYALEGRPEALQLVPADGVTGAAVAFLLWHQGHPVDDVRYLVGSQSVRLDWEQPWSSRFELGGQRVHSPVLPYLYVRFSEVRKEIVLRPYDVQRYWQDLGLAGRDQIAVAEQEALEARLAAFVAERTPLTIDGVPAQGTLREVSFLRRSLRSAPIISPPEALDLRSALVLVAFTYPVDGLPQQVEMAYDLFPPGLDEIVGSTTDVLSVQDVSLRRDGAEALVWTNRALESTLPAMVSVPRPAAHGVWSLSVGSVLAASAGLLAFVLAQLQQRRRRQLSTVLLLIALGCSLGAWGLRDRTQVDLPAPHRPPPTLSASAAKAVTSSLLINSYRAFDVTDPDRVRDRLGLSLHGEALEAHYLDTARSLAIAGGAPLRVTDVRVLEALPTGTWSPAGFQLAVSWRVTGEVAHWGHTHTRRQAFAARVDVRNIDGSWKITGVGR